MSSPVVQILILIGALVGASALVIVVGFVLYRRFRRAVAAPVQPFTLAQLRQMRADGLLSEAEYERAKAAMIAHSRAGLADGVAFDSGSPGIGRRSAAGDDSDNAPHGAPEP